MYSFRSAFVRVSVLAFLFALCIPSASADTVLLNPGFEAPIVPGDSRCGPYSDCIGYLNGVGDSIGAWLVIGKSGVDSNGDPIPGALASILLLGYDYTEPNNTTGDTLHFHPAAGLQAVDLTGEGNQGTTNGIKQIVSTTPGQQYQLTFSVGHQDSGAEGYDMGAASVALWIGDNQAGIFNNSADTLNDVNWETFSYSFIATSDSTPIAFLNNTPVGNNFAGLDNVSISEVPEPASLTLLATGALGLLAARRRRA